MHCCVIIVEIPLSPYGLKVVNNTNPFTRDYAQGEEINIPIAHGEGNYYCDEATLQELQENNQIVFRYAGTNPERFRG